MGILTRKNLGKKDLTRIINKLRRQERLTPDEFWIVYESLWQEGPSVKYPSAGWRALGELSQMPLRRKA